MPKLTRENPIHAVVQTWCDERNRQTYVAWRGALSLLLLVAALFSPHPWGLSCAIGLVAVLGSFAWFPRWELARVVLSYRWEFVPDRLLMLLAESSKLDAETKLELAEAAAKGGGLTYGQLALFAAQASDDCARAERELGAGYGSLLSLICTEQEAR